MNHGGISATPDNIGINAFLAKMYYMGGKIGVNIFIILSAYFYTEKNISYEDVVTKIRGVRSIVLQYAVAIYSVVIVAAVNNIIPEPLFGEGGVITAYNLLRTLFPLVYSNNWYASAYVIFLIVLPILNRGIIRLEKKDYIVVLVGLILFLIVGPTISGDVTIMASNQASNLAWFTTMFLITTYLKKYRIEKLRSIKCEEYIVLIVICYCFFALSILLMDRFDLYLQIAQPYISVYMMQINSIPVVVCSFAIFFLLTKIKLTSVFINNLGGLIFGIYLFHDNPFISRHIWNLFISGIEGFSSKYFWLISIARVFIIFALCALIEIIRKKLIFTIKTVSIKCRS
jgi:hypothetical protein